MFFKKSKEKTVKEYQEKLKRIDQQLADLERLAGKYQAYTRQIVQK